MYCNINYINYKIHYETGNFIIYFHNIGPMPNLQVWIIERSCFMCLYIMLFSVIQYWSTRSKPFEVWRCSYYSLFPLALLCYYMNVVRDNRLWIGLEWDLCVITPVVWEQCRVERTLRTAWRIWEQCSVISTHLLLRCWLPLAICRGSVSMVTNLPEV